LGYLYPSLPNMVLVSVVIVTYNNATTIGLCLDSLLEEHKSCIDVEIIVVDNASTDETVQKVEAKGIRPIKSQINLGFCGGNNLGLRQVRGDYVLLLNPDAMITKGYLTKAVFILQSDPRIALMTGKVLRMNPDGAPFIVNGYAMIDSTGIHLKPNRQAVDIGMGELDKGQYDRPAYVSAVCGAVCFCRVEALSELTIDGQVFDELFFAYKEDVDLGWRAHRLGWTCYYTPEIVAYHARNWKGDNLARSSIPLEVRYHSFKNRRITILKNENVAGFLCNCLPIMGFEIFALGYAIFRDAYLLKAYKDIWRNLPRIYHWRREINERAKANQ
jgi:GT2 family glycosyltransferase